MGGWPGKVQKERENVEAEVGKDPGHKGRRWRAESQRKQEIMLDSKAMLWKRRV